MLAERCLLATGCKWLVDIEFELEVDCREGSNLVSVQGQQFDELEPTVCLNDVTERSYPSLQVVRVDANV